ncbi:hypothetical protein D3C87_2079470 [compost metagenome]
MSNQYHRPLGQFDGLDNRVDPVLGIGLVPIGLFHDGGRRHLFGPAHLPVAGT